MAPSRPRSLLVFLLATFSQIGCVDAFSDTGHHVIAVLAFNSLALDQQQEAIRILQANPRFNDDFMPPESIESDPAAVARWQIGVTGEWPDIIRSVPCLTLPTRCRAGDRRRGCAG